MDSGQSGELDAAVRDGATSDAQADAAAPSDELSPALRAAGVSALFPASSAEGVCRDLTLRITFSAAPVLGSTGKVQLFDRARPTAAVVTLDLAQPTVTQTVAGESYQLPRAAFVDGSAAVFSLPAPLAYGHEYFVRVERGVVSAAGKASFAVEDDLTWSFRTRAAAPGDLSRLSVALDGSGDFCSLQGALDALEGFTSSAEIAIARGTFHGIARARGKRDLTIRGADRKQTVLTGINNEQLNGGTQKRALVSFENSQGVTIERLTIRNQTPQGGSQAEALRLERCQRCSVRDAEIFSLQDTLLWSGSIYARDVLIAGNVDFIWGTGAAYFEHSEIRTIGRKGYTVQARNAKAAYGYVFVDSRLTGEPGIRGHFLARVDGSAYPDSQVAFIDCELGEHIDPAGFLLSGGPSAGLRFWEYRSRTPSGALVDTTQRAAFVKQLSSDEAQELRDAQVVLGFQP